MKRGAAETQSSHQRGVTAAHIACAIIVGNAAMLFTGLQPILLGSLVAGGLINEADMGRVAMSEILAFAGGGAIGAMLVRAGRNRLIALACGLMALLADLASIRADSSLSFILLRATAGCMQGLSLVPCMAVMMQAARAERVIGLFHGLTAIPAVIADYYLAVSLIPRYGPGAGFAILAGFQALAVAAAYGLKDGPSQTSAQQGSVNWDGRKLLFCCAVLLATAGIGAAWSYCERIGAMRGLDGARIGFAISGAIVFQIIGALTVSAVAWRIPYRIALPCGWTGLGLAAFSLLMAPGHWGYVGSLWAFSFLWLGLLPFQFKAMISFDPSGKLALLNAPISMIGLSMGPLFASFIIPSQGLSGVTEISMILLTVAVFLFLLLLKENSTPDHQYNLDKNFL